MVKFVGLLPSNAFALLTEKNPPISRVSAVESARFGANSLVPADDLVFDVQLN